MYKWTANEILRETVKIALLYPVLLILHAYIGFIMLWHWTWIIVIEMITTPWQIIVILLHNRWILTEYGLHFQRQWPELLRRVQHTLDCCVRYKDKLGRWDEVLYPIQFFNKWCVHPWWMLISNTMKPPKAWIFTARKTAFSEYSYSVLSLLIS